MDGKIIENLGDVNPLDHGGFFVVDLGEGRFQAEVLEPDDEDDDGHYTIYRFDLDKCTYINGVLSDNQFHPDKPAWFAKELQSMADQFEGMTLEDMAAKFCSDDPRERAFAYREVGMYFGYQNLDGYPITDMRRRELKKRYASWLKRK